MNNSKVLDCTLRDGGYCNQWKFGEKNIIKVLSKLTEAKIDIIECGFLTNKGIYTEDYTKYNHIETINGILQKLSSNSMFVCMLNYGEFDAEQLPRYNGEGIQGIRVAFHKKNKLQAIEECKKIKEKGYKVFLQAMVSLSYTDQEFLELIHDCNELEPYALYIVDSFGAMEWRDIVRYFYLMEHNLKKGIYIGYHAHNNKQLAYSNAQKMLQLQTNRQLIIDSSLMGMGRGAGNLNTELIIEYLNRNKKSEYQIKLLLQAIDEVINSFFHRSFWGYSAVYYLSSTYNIHPNYATYLSDKNTLKLENIDEIFSEMDVEKRVSYDQNYIEKLYRRYMLNIDTEPIMFQRIQSLRKNKKILILLPGKSIEEESKIIHEFMEKYDGITISVNFSSRIYKEDYIFLSNLRRTETIDIVNNANRIIATSNIPNNGFYLSIPYKKLLNDVPYVEDNACMMLLKLLTLFTEADEIYLAGLDGFSTDSRRNYYRSEYEIFAKNETYQAINQALAIALGQFAKECKIQFITTPRYVTM
ncbi:MAG: aldolase catalytic domain-containing protein [bacterium]|nr:aldolase catalytic domain-containing protein [bacterium]